MVKIDISHVGDAAPMLALKLQTRRTEIEKQTEIAVRCGQIIDKLDFVGFRKRTNRFQFADQVVVYDKIGDEIADNYIFVAHTNPLADLG